MTCLFNFEYGINGKFRLRTDTVIYTSSTKEFIDCHTKSSAKIIADALFCLYNLTGHHPQEIADKLYEASSNNIRRSFQDKERESLKAIYRKINISANKVYSEIKEMTRIARMKNTKSFNKNILLLKEAA